LVKAATRKKIERAIKSLGYIRNRAAQTMHGKRSGTIGLIVPTIDHAIFAELIQAFSDSVDNSGFTLLLASHGYDLKREYAVLRKLLEHRVDGVAFIGLEHSEDSYQLIEQQQIPAIAIWNYDESSRISCVGADNKEAGRMAAELLVQKGYEKIGLMFPQTQGNDRAGDRKTGAIEALLKRQITVPESWQIEVPYSISLAKSACLKLLGAHDRPNALLCGNDVIAQGAIYAAQQLGLSIPTDIAITGIGDFKGSDAMEPALTTVRIPARKIGEIAGELISRTIAGHESTLVRQKCELTSLARSTT
jgi:LacI family transcriptional regulator